MRWSCLRLGAVYVDVNWRMNLANDVDRGRTPNDNDKLKGSDDIICI